MSESKLSPVIEEDEQVRPKTEPDVGTANETIPHITNDVEGTKEQKAAVKKLSAYSDDVRRKMAKGRTNEEVEETSQDGHGRGRKPDHEEVEEAPQQEQSLPSPPLLSINTLTILGTVLAIACLYFAYRADKRDAVAVVRTREPEDTTPKEKAPDRKRRSTSKIRTLN